MAVATHIDDKTEVVRRTEVCTVATVRRVAAMLDLDPDTYREGDPLPRGWQFVLLAGEARRSDLREDGFPGLGVPLPALGLPRLLLGGRSVEYSGEITIGERLQRESFVEKVSHKETPTGPLAVVTIAHKLTCEDGRHVLSETQTYLMMTAQTGSRKLSEGGPIPGIATASVVIPDDVLIYQYSALGFNSHRIHWDRGFARDAEGFPDLVVNGGLATLLLTEHLRRRHGKSFDTLKARHSSPLFASRPLHLTAEQVDQTWMLRAFDDEGRLSLEIEAR